MKGGGEIAKRGYVIGNLLPIPIGIVGIRGFSSDEGGRWEWGISRAFVKFGFKFR